MQSLLHAQDDLRRHTCRHAQSGCMDAWCVGVAWCCHTHASSSDHVGARTRSTVTLVGKAGMWTGRGEMGNQSGVQAHTFQLSIMPHPAIAIAIALAQAMSHPAIAITIARWCPKCLERGRKQGLELRRGKSVDKAYQMARFIHGKPTGWSI